MIIQSTDKTGSVCVKVIADGMESNSVTMEIKPRARM